MRDVCCVVGGQFGSEGKGNVVAHLAGEYDHHVRVGAANAGHTFYTEDDGGPVKHVVQQLPVAAYSHPEARVYLGPGALISPDILDRELQDLVRWRDQRGLLTDMPLVGIDFRAQVIQRGHIEREKASGLAGRIGSTSATASEGIGAAQAARVMRDDSCVPAIDWAWPRQVAIVNVPRMIRRATGGVLLEGTQGAGLGLLTGGFPYVTSREVSAAALCADSGVAPTRVERVVMVLRTYPIRVAGNSGPFPRDSHEISWADLGVDQESERTTVTRKVRRVATFSMVAAVEAAMVNGATEIALMFADYLEPTIGGAHGRCQASTLMSYPRIYDLCQALEDRTGAAVTMLGTGPHSIIDIVADVTEQEEGS